MMRLAFYTLFATLSLTFLTSLIPVNAANRTVLEAYRVDNPPKSAYFGKMKTRWAHHTKQRNYEQTIKNAPPNRALPMVTPKQNTVQLRSNSAPTLKNNTPTQSITRQALKPVAVSQPVKSTRNSQALPFWNQLPAR